ncbi:MAG: hypothetical protein ACRDQX_12820, partial [Pseudonocardiaceae bacterium]
MTAPDEPVSIQGTRVRKNRGYESLRREMLQDTRISFKAQGILTYLLSLPETWTTSSERLSDVRPGSKGKVKEGRESIRAGLRELEATGYLRRERKSVAGRWRWEWRYTDDPEDLAEPSRECREGLAEPSRECREALAEPSRECREDPPHGDPPPPADTGIAAGQAMD